MGRRRRCPRDTPSRIAALLLGTVLSLAAASAPPGAAAQQPVDVGRPMDPEAAIKIWNGGGSVRVEGWNADSVAVSGAVEEGRGRFFFVGGRDVAKLGVEGDQAQVAGRLVVRVPMAATVWIRTGTADIVVRGLTGAVDISTVAGDVDVRSRPQTFYAESMEGDLELNIEAGIARARTGTGGIAFTGTVQDLTLRSVDGRLDVTASELRRGRFANVAGAIVFDGGVRLAGALVFETHSGDVTLALPSDLDADFRLSTFEGALHPGYGASPGPEAGSGRRSALFETGASSLRRPPVAERLPSDIQQRVQLRLHAGG